MGAYGYRHLSRRMLNRQIGVAKVCTVRKALDQLMLGRGLARDFSALLFWLPCVRTCSYGSPVCHVVPVVVSCCVGGVWATDRKSAIPFDDQAKPDVHVRVLVSTVFRTDMVQV